MERQLRETGIVALGAMPWGTHLCHLYETKPDLLDTLVPFFKAGLEATEYCLWVVSEPLTEQESWQALRQAVPNLDRYVLEQSIQVVNGRDWYLNQGVLNLKDAIGASKEKLDQALAQGYAGMRLSGGDAFWLEPNDRVIFGEYERELDESITDRQMMILCTYPLAKSGASEILDLARTHQLVLARRGGNWDVLETPKLKKTKAEVERGVQERTAELRTANALLREEIAVRKRAEDALRESEEPFRRYFELGLIGMAITSPTKGIIEVNDEICAILGYERRELLQTTWAALTHPDDLAADVAQFQRAMAGEIDGYSMDKRWIRKDGEVIDTTISVKCLRRADGSVDYFLALLQDITDRKHAEEELRRAHTELERRVTERTNQLMTVNTELHAEVAERKWAEGELRRSEAYLSEGQRLSHTGSWAWNVMTGDLFWSSEHFRIFGLDPQAAKLSYEEFFGMVYPKDQPSVREGFDRAFRNKSEYETEYRIVRPDRTIRHVHSISHPVFNEVGDLTEYVGTVIDTTERERADQALRENEQVLGVYCAPKLGHRKRHSY